MTIEININLIIWGVALLLIAYLLWYLKAKASEKEIRKDANKRQRSVVNGEVYEKILPLLPNFPYNPRDLVFVWKWFDFLVFDGLTNWKIDNIIFLEVKTWNSTLNWNEREIKNAIKENRIKYAIHRKY